MALEWKPQRPGFFIAHALLRTYRVFFEVPGEGLGAVWRTQVDGMPIGTSKTDDEAKAKAQAHNDR